MDKREIFTIKFYLYVFKWILTYIENYFLMIAIISSTLFFSYTLAALGWSNLNIITPAVSDNFMHLEPLIQKLVPYFFYGAFLAIVVMAFIQYFYKATYQQTLTISFRKKLIYVGGFISALFAVAFLANIIIFEADKNLVQLLRIYGFSMIAMFVFLAFNHFANKISNIIHNDKLYEKEEEK